jgi:hypothetical protein
MPKNQTSQSKFFIFHANNEDFQILRENVYLKKCPILRILGLFVKLFFRENLRDTLTVQPNSVSTCFSPCPPPPSPSAAALAAVPPAALPAGPENEGRPV